MKQLEGKHISKTYEEAGFFTTKRKVALKPMDIAIDNGEILAVVGESGSGKSTLANILGFLYAPTTGHIYYNGEEIHYPLSHQIRRDIQMIFQNPFTTLHPLHTIRKSLVEPIRFHQVVKREEEEDYIKNLLERCRLPEDILDRYPSMLSGGQLQRVNIVRALSLKPKILIADEIITALDVPVALDVLELLKDLQKENHLSILFISHDLAAVRKIAGRAIVMKNGEVLEENSVENLFISPKSAYTKTLIDAIPKL